jgi:hypothetical protein
VVFTRRPGARFNRGRIAVASGGGAAPVTPLTILGSLAWWVRADLGVTIGTGVSAWADQSGNGVNFIQGTGSAQPALLAADINGQPAIAGDGINDVLSAPWARVAPGTQPFFIWLICKQITWTSLDTTIGDYTVTGFVELQRIASPGVEAYNSATTSGNNTGGVIGSYFRHEMQFGATAADYLKIGSVTVTGAMSNDAGGGTIQLFNRGDSFAGRYSNAAIAEAFAYLGTPTAPQRAALDAYVVSRYPSAGV